MRYRILWAIPVSMLYTESSQNFPAVRMVTLGLEFLKGGNLEEAERLMQEALEVARRGHHPIGRGMAALSLSNIYWGTGRAPLARDLARRARDVFSQQAGPDQRHNEAIATFNLALVHHLTGDHFAALNGYHAALELLDTARQYWVTHNQNERVLQCNQLKVWIQHLMERLITSEPHERSLTLFLPIGLMDGSTATLWGEYARDTSVLLDGKTLQVIPLQDPLVLTADCCVFPTPPQVWQEIRPPAGQAGDYVLTLPGDPLPDDPFYVVQDSQVTRFIRHSDGKVIYQHVRIIGGMGPKTYRPIAFLT